MDSKPEQAAIAPEPQTNETDEQIQELVDAFKVKLKIKDEKKLEERKQVRKERVKRREDGESDVSSDTEDELERVLKDKDEQQKAEIIGKRERELSEKLTEKAKSRFSYDRLVDGLKKGSFKKIVVVTGAGISVAAGIPDFRSPKTGLYANLSQYNLPQPESMFELEYFRKKPEAFYHLAKEFLSLKKYMPTPTHHFINLLDKEGVLQLNMTQNIDNLEGKAGINPKKLVQAHGANIGASCSRCKKAYDRDTLDDHIERQEIYHCTGDFEWTETEYEKDENGKYIYSESGDYVIKEEKKLKEHCHGPIKPNIVFFGEKMPDSFHTGWDFIRNTEFWTKEDNPKPLYEDGGCDLMIVIGTAMAVFPFSATINQVPKDCPKVLINLENIADNGYDFEDLLNHPERLFLQGRCQATIQQICKDVGWDKKLEGLISKCEQKYAPKPKPTSNKTATTNSLAPPKANPKVRGASKQGTRKQTGTSPQQKKPTGTSPQQKKKAVGTTAGAKSTKK